MFYPRDYLSEIINELNNLTKKFIHYYLNYHSIFEKFTAEDSCLIGIKVIEPKLMDTFIIHIQDNIYKVINFGFLESEYFTNEI